MENIVVYNQNVEKLLDRSGYQLGTETISQDSASCQIVRFWFSKDNVISVYFSDGIVKLVKHCNTGTKIYASNTMFSEFFDKLKAAILYESICSPSLCDAFEGVVFGEHDDYTTKLQKIEVFRPKMNNDFARIFTNEIADWERSTCGVHVEPEQFQFYRHKYEDDLYYVSEVIEDEAVLLKDISSLMSRERYVSLRELSNSYRQEDVPDAPQYLITRCIGSFEEILDPTNLLKLLSLLGYSNLDAIDALQPPKDLFAFKLPMVMDPDPLSRSIYFRRDNWSLSVNTFSLAGYCHLDCTERADRELVDCTSLLDTVKPSMFERFVTSFLGSFLIRTNYILYQMPEIRTYLHSLLKAMETIKPPADISYNSTWNDFMNPGFDPVEYLETKYQADVSKLPTASVRNCKNEQECDSLYNELHYLLTLD